MFIYVFLSFLENSDPQTIRVHIYLTYIYYHKKVRKARSYVVSFIYIGGMGKSCHRLVRLQKKKALFCFVLSKAQNKEVIHVI